jgi:hypothetical protein
MPPYLSSYDFICKTPSLGQGAMKQILPKLNAPPKIYPPDDAGRIS